MLLQKVEMPGRVERAILPRSGDPRSFPLPEEQLPVQWLRHWNNCRRNWKMLAMISLAGSSIGLLIAFIQQPSYHAQVTVEVQGISDNFLKAQDGNPNANAGAEVTDLQTQIRVIQSESLIGKATARLLHGRYGSAREKAVRTAAASVAAHTAGQTRLIEIATDSTDPAVAAEFVNVLADEFITQHVEARWEGTQRAAEKLRAALDLMKDKLERSEAALQEYARQSGLLLNADHTSVNDDKLHQLQADFARATTDRIAMQSRFDSLAQAGPDAPSASDDPSLRSAQDKLTDLDRGIAELTATYTAEYPKVKRLEAQVAPLQAAIERHTEVARTRIRVQYDEAKRREELVSAAYQRQAATVILEAEKKVHYDVLRREVDSTRSIYDTMLSRVKEAGIASTLRGSNVRVLDPARPPADPSRPRRFQLLFLGTLAGLFAGGLVTTAKGQSDRTLQAPGDINLFLNVPEFGVVPAMRAGQLANRLDVDRYSLRADSFRSIITSMLFKPEGDGPGVFVVTSAHAGEGKTTVARDVAIALTGIGKQVLLIDGDLRRPQLHRAFGVANDLGLSQLLTSETAVNAETVTGAIVHTGHAGLFLMPAGYADLYSPDLLYSKRLREIVDESRKFFDIVVIDTPPLLQIPDARVIGRVSDGVIMVVRAGKTTREAALAVHQRLIEDGTPVIGSVLNAWDPKTSPGYYGQYVPSGYPRDGLLSSGNA